VTTETVAIPAVTPVPTMIFSATLPDADAHLDAGRDVALPRREIPAVLQLVHALAYDSLVASTPSSSRT
jgi:hypothetical protein